MPQKVVGSWESMKGGTHNRKELLQQAKFFRKQVNYGEASICTV